MIGVVRTPEDAFEGLPEYPFDPHYREADGLRLAHIESGTGAPVVFLHGEPTWSFLYRRVIPPVREAGFRCIAPDLPGFGRSDKPVDLAWYSYDRHVDATGALLEGCDLRGATLVVHDQGGPIGLRVAVEHRDRVDRIVILDTDLATGHHRRTDAWFAFRDFVANTEDLPIGTLVSSGCATKPSDAVIAAYEAPFPNAASKAGARAFPQLIPLSPTAPTAATNERVLEALREDRRPMLMLWADSDPVYPVSAGERFAQSLGQPPPRIITNAAHFIPEDQGSLLGELIAEWLTA